MGRLLLSLGLGLISLALLELALVAPATRSSTTQSPGPTAKPYTTIEISGLNQPSNRLRTAPGPLDRGRIKTLSVIQPRGSSISTGSTSHSLTAQRATSITLDHQAFLPLVRSRGSMTEARALWVTRWDYTTITDVRTVIERASRAGFNMILFQVRGAADAFYTPGLEPWAARLGGGRLGEDPGWDPLRTAIEAAHARGLELHAYLNVYPVWLGQTPPPTETDPVHLFWTLSYDHSWDDWRVVDSEGVTMTLRQGYLWATPALTDAVDRVVSVTKDLASRYNVDGIHLDMVRYPGPDYSYDPFSNAGYEAARARDEDLSRAEWQRRRVTGLIQRVYEEAVLTQQDLRLSAAVWPIYEDQWGWDYLAGYSDYYQDSQTWIEDGMIDTIMPMLYTGMFISDPKALTVTQFALVASDFLIHDGGRQVFLGISAENLEFRAVSERITIARELGAPGHAIFSAGVLDEKGYWEALATGPYATEAILPPMPWRP